MPIVKPGDILRKELHARGMTQRELARRMGRPYQAINEIINGKKHITPQTAIQLGRVFGTGSEIWLGLEYDYRLAVQREKEA
jgi:addiction module HigA family antidote